VPLVQQVYLLCTKIRSRLCDNTLDNLYFLHTFIMVANPLHSVTHMKNSGLKQSLITDGRLTSSFVLRMLV